MRQWWEPDFYIGQQREHNIVMALVLVDIVMDIATGGGVVNILGEGVVVVVADSETGDFGFAKILKILGD